VSHHQFIVVTLWQYRQLSPGSSALQKAVTVWHDSTCDMVGDDVWTSTGCLRYL